MHGFDYLVMDYRFLVKNKIRLLKYYSIYITNIFNINLNLLTMKKLSLEQMEVIEGGRVFWGAEYVNEGDGWWTRTYYVFGIAVRTEHIYVELLE